MADDLCLSVLVPISSRFAGRAICFKSAAAPRKPGARKVHEPDISLQNDMAKIIAQTVQNRLDGPFYGSYEPLPPSLRPA
jgi:hypothetical protein